MTTADTRTHAEAPASPKRGLMRRAGRRFAIACALAMVTAGAGIAFLASDTALELVLRTVVARSDGRLGIEEPTGSLLSTVRAKRIAWLGSDATLTADQVALTWSPAALFSRGIVVRSVSAQHIALTIRPSDTATTLPASLSLPTEVAIARVAVERFDWAFGTSRGAIHGLKFGYEGGARAHRLHNLALAADRGTLSGEATLGAVAPFALTGSLAVNGDATLKDAHADVALAGTLAAVVLDGRGSVGEARWTLQARLSPLAAIALDEFALDVRDLDIARWDEALPVTRLTVKAEGRPKAGGLAGRVDVENALPGRIDGRRVPLRSARARFAWADEALMLEDLDVTLAGRGRATGRATIPLAGGAGKWALALSDIDLKQIYAPLSATLLSGSIVADLDARRQRIDGDIADRTIAGGVGVRFGATLADGKLDVERFRVRAGTGELAGRARMDLGGERAFHVNATATRLDPSHFGEFPAASVDGEIAASGVLHPAWRVDGNARLAAGSKFEGVPVSGTARATLASRIARDVVVDLKLAASTLAVRGSAGEAGSLLSVTLDAPHLAELAPLLPARLPRPIAGALRAKAELRGILADGGMALEAKGEALKIGSAFSLATLAARIAIDPSTATGTPSTFAERHFGIEFVATDVVAPTGSFPRARASVEGTLGRHTATLVFTGEDLDVAATARGGLDPAHTNGGIAGWRWMGTLDTLENRGAWPLRIVAPVALDVERDRIKIGSARLAMADGKVEIAELSWNDGRVSTRGSYSGVPVATLARLAGVRLPLASTLELNGDWSVAATPRLNGSLTLRRAQGDLFLLDESIVAPADRAFLITALDVAAQFRDDAIDATAALRSGRGANVDARVAIGVAPGAPPGRIVADAPLQIALTAELSTLRFVQPWFGTVAVVDGAAHLELAAGGTVGQPVLTGALTSTGLRIDAAEYGLHFADGRLAATLADGTLRLDELSLVGGGGRFTASGTLASAAQARRDPESARARIAWQAERFRVLNRPDLRLVASGAGTLAIADHRLSIDGRLRADEGHFDYSPDTRVTLGDDVVVKGWPPRRQGVARTERIPLTLDLELDFGDKLSFSGEGLEAGLRGKLAVTTAPDGSLRGRGSIRTERGSFFAFGQRLTIDRGRLIFDGPLDNPGLDIVALRKNLAVEAGVAVSGTVRVPIIQLTSNPQVPDNEKLSWLVLGQGLARTSGGDVAALQAASAVLFGRTARPITTTIAQSVGLDDITFRTASGTADGAVASGQAVAFGKRLTDRLSLVYEQGLTVATNALRLEYSLSRTLTLRAEAGVISGFGIYYRRTFE